jgi:hypothetical protein
LQDIIGFLTYLWSVAGGPLLFLLIPGIVLQEITKILETPIRHGIVNRIQYENNRIEDDLNLSGFRRKVYESYENNQRSWNRGLNALVLIGFVLHYLEFLEFCSFSSWKWEHTGPDTEPRTLKIESEFRST